MAGYPVGFSGPKIDEALQKILSMDVTENGCIKLVSTPESPLDLDTAIYPGYFSVEYYKSTKGNLPFSHRPLVFYNYVNGSETVQMVSYNSLTYLRVINGARIDPWKDYTGFSKLRIGATAPVAPYYNELWIDVSTPASPVLMVYDEATTSWVELLSPDLLRKSVYDPQNKGTDIFKYIDDKIKAADVGTITKEFEDHIADATIHVTAEQVAAWNTKVTSDDVTAAFNALDTLIQTYVSNAASGSLTDLSTALNTAITALDTKVSTHIADATVHPTEQQQAEWDSKAAGDHIHKADDANNTWISVGSSGTILRSTDNGLTWTKIYSGITDFLYDIHYSNNTWIAVGYNGTILRSTNNGLTWTKINSGVSGVSGELYGIYYANNTWITSGYGGLILRSIDDGLTWTQTPVSGIYSNLQNIYHNANNTWIIVGSNGTILRSTDNGLTWTKIDSRVPSSYLQGIHYSNSIWIITGNNGFIYRSIDDGLTWTQINVSGGFLYTIYYANNTWITAGESGTISRSTDDGLTWTNINSGVSGNTDLIYDISYVNNTWITAGNSGTILRSTDNGLTWTKTPVGVDLYNLRGIYYNNQPAVQIDASNIVSGELDDARIPKVVYFHAITVADDTARFALTTDIINLGDSVYVESSSNYYYVIDITKLSSEDGYQLYSSTKVMSLDFSNILNLPTTIAGYGITDGTTKTYVDNAITTVNTALDTLKTSVATLQKTAETYTTYTDLTPPTADQLQATVNELTVDVSTNLSALEEIAQSIPAIVAAANRIYNKITTPQ